jgi:acyl carrier protein
MTPELRIAVARLVEDATDGLVSCDEALVSSCSLHDLGVTSLGYLRLLHGVEETFGVFLDVEGGDGDALDFDGLVSYVDARARTASLPSSHTGGRTPA